MTDLSKAAEMTQPEALRLADMLELWGSEETLSKAADELRRLHEENEQLRQALAQPQEWKTCRHCGFQYRPPKEDKWHPLAQPEQEPAAWQDPQYKTLIEPHKAHPDWIPLYTAPPKREWVGLTDEEIHEMIMGMRSRNMGVIMTEEIFRDVEAKLKEKNGG